MSTHHVYIIAHWAEDGLQRPVKVGVTRSLGPRLASLQTGNSRRLAVAFDFKLPDRRSAYEVERRFHEQASEFRLSGEWFDMEPLWALESLVGLVFDELESRFNGVDRDLLIQMSNAPQHLSTVVTEFWGLPQ